MAIKINGTEVVDDTRNFINIESVNNVAVAPAKPAIISPIDGSQTLESSITFQSTAFEGLVVSDDHASSDWEVATDSGFSNIVASTTDDTSNLTSWTVSGLSVDTYFVRVRHSGATLGDSEYSDAVSFSIIEQVLYAWGEGQDGRLGYGDDIDVSSPVLVSGGFTDWESIGGGRLSGFGIRSTKDLYAWGVNNTGQLGDGTTIDRTSPVTVVGNISWSSIAGGYEHVLGISSDGIAYAWGTNNTGRLGDGTEIDRSSPVTVIGGITNWKQLSSGGAVSLGVTTDGLLYGWGRNTLGQIGDGTLTDRSSPVTVAGGITNWKQVSVSSSHSTAVTSDGLIYGWGNDDVGLGNIADPITSPVTVIGGITDWDRVDAGNAYSLATRSNGVLYAWGGGGNVNENGKLGDGTTINRTSPVTVVGGITDWISISAGVDESAAIRSNGVLYAWGRNTYGQLGDGTTIDRSSPVTVIGGITDWSSVVSNQFWIMAIAAE